MFDFLGIFSGFFWAFLILRHEMGQCVFLKSFFYDDWKRINSVINKKKQT